MSGEDLPERRRSGEFAPPRPPAPPPRTEAAAVAAPGTDIERPSGELQPWELAFRFGLLISAAVFLAEGMGSPFSRSPLFLAAALTLSGLMVLTLALQWRMLGDWRAHTQQAVLVGLALVLVVPLTAALDPSLQDSALPGPIEAAVTQTLEGLSSVPGLGIALSALEGLMIFLVWLVLLVVLIAHSGTSRRGGLIFVGVLVGAMTLFWHPAAETIVGYLLLGYFMRVQWEPAVMVPRRLRPHLSRVQMDFLRELTRQGWLSTGETKLYLGWDARAFAELLDYRLVEYDSFARQVVPGERLLHDPATETLEAFLGAGRRVLWVAAGVFYLVMPDLIPGPVDDLIVMAICAGAGFSWIGALMSSVRGRPPSATPRR